MAYCGFLIFQGKMNWAVSIMVATFGVISGVTISYVIGHTLGFTFLRKYGKYIHMGSEKLEKTSKWFERYGNKLLVVTYFIPGVRHVTGYFSGITKIPFRKFAIRAYVGAFIWTGTFISLGKILGSNWEKFHASITKYLIIGGLIIATAIIVIYLYRNYKAQIIEAVINLFINSIKIFHSLGRLKIVISFISLVFIGLSALVIGLIQDFLANEFNQFDTISTFIIKSIFKDNWTYIMNLFGFASFIIVRHAKKPWIRTSSWLLALVFSIFSGLSPLFFQTHYPSDVAAGYVFGGVWLSLNIVLLEVFRILPKEQHQ